MCGMGSAAAVTVTKGNNEMNFLRSWSDLPSEILWSIADRLELIELLSFRGTCKDFRSASSTASAKIQSLRTPWLLFHKANSSECLIINDHRSKAYNRTIPDLQSAICLASYQGWLLLHKDGSTFFFCPFSLAKITLPDFPQNQIDGHVAAFSEVPTSPKCIVSVMDENSTNVYMISRGQTRWSQHEVPKGSSLKSKVMAGTFDDKTETFYYMDDAKSVMSFRGTDKIWKRYNIVEGVRSKDAHWLPYLYLDHVFGNKIEEKREELELEEDEYVAVCGLSFKHVTRDIQWVYLNELIDVSPMKTRIRRAIWIQPRFFQSHTNQFW